MCARARVCVGGGWGVGGEEEVVVCEIMHTTRTCTSTGDHRVSSHHAEHCYA